MANGKEIRTKIKSVKNTQKITRAMEMVATSKMRRAQEHMKQARPYAEKIRHVAAHLSQAFIDYKHPYIGKRDVIKRAGLIIITSDKGLCGGLNTNALRLAINTAKQWHEEGIETVATTIGSKGFSFIQRTGMQIISYVSGLGDTPRLDALIGRL